MKINDLANRKEMLVTRLKRALDRLIALVGSSRSRAGSLHIRKGGPRKVRSSTLFFLLFLDFVVSNGIGQAATVKDASLPESGASFAVRRKTW
jgi:hypothetical protein